MFTNLGDLIDRTRAPEKLAFIETGVYSSPREFTYAAFDKMARGVARGLRDRGLKRGERIAIPWPIWRASSSSM